MLHRRRHRSCSCIGVILILFDTQDTRKDDHFTFSNLVLDICCSWYDFQIPFVPETNAVSTVAYLLHRSAILMTYETDQVTLRCCCEHQFHRFRVRQPGQ